VSGRGWSLAAGLLLLATLALGRLGAPAEHAAAGWRAWPGFDFVFGLLGCIAIVLASKALGRLGLQQPEDEDASPEGDTR